MSKGMKWFIGIAVTLFVAAIGAVYAYGEYRGQKIEIDKRQDAAIKQNVDDIKTNTKTIQAVKNETEKTNEFLKLYKPEIFKQAEERIDERNGTEQDSIPAHEYSTEDDNRDN